MTRFRATLEVDFLTLFQESFCEASDILKVLADSIKDLALDERVDDLKVAAIMEAYEKVKLLEDNSDDEFEVA